MTAFVRPGDAMIGLAASIGYEVHFVTKIVRRSTDRPVPKGYESMGYTDYERRVIQVSTAQPAGAVFLVLAHEVGHALAARRMGIDRLPASRRKRARTGEARAYLYGWAALRHVGAADLVTRELWREEHSDMPGITLRGGK